MEPWRVDYLNAIVDFNEAQVNLYCARASRVPRCWAGPPRSKRLQPDGPNPPPGQNTAPHTTPHLTTRLSRPRPRLVNLVVPVFVLSPQ